MIDKVLIKQIIPKLNFSFPYEVDDYVEHLYLENYHCHKDFSNTYIADSAETIENYAEHIKKLGSKCLYSGEHGSQGNHFHVYNVAEKNNLKYRHSAEVYWVKDRFEKDNKNCHMMLIAKNKEGREDINYIISMANIDGFYSRPRIDLDLLLNVPKENIIVTSACVAGWKYEDAEDIWLRIHDYFGDNFFFEVQYHNTAKQKELNERILMSAKKNDVQLICGLDSHYVKPENEIKRNQILEYKQTVYEDEEGWYLDYPDTNTVIERFKKQGVLSDEEIMTSIMNTNVFVNECKDIIIDRSFKIPSLYKDKTYEEKCRAYKHILNEVYKKENLKSKAKAEGIRYEVNEVIKSGVVDYFLTNQKLVEAAVKDEGGILTTTSRGSAASFVSNKLIGLTTVDRFNSDIIIYPERFLTSERVLSGQMPDIDLNVAEQEPFVRATKKLLGEHGCYPLMAKSHLKEKSAWLLYASVNDVSPEHANQISKYLDDYNKALKYADEEDRKYIKADDYIPEEYIDIYRRSFDYQGIMIKLTPHSCGHLIFDGDIRREVGLISAVSEAKKDRTICACVEGGMLDEFGYVKEDFLIVDSTHLTYKFFKEGLNRNVPTFEELREMIKDDPKTWEIYEKGITCCINQCEKLSTTNKCKRYKPKTIAELSAFIAGIRPGFSSLINTFINREKYSTGEPKIDELLEDTSHFMLYQESIMKVLSFLGVSMSDTYGIIKSISKKKMKDKQKSELLNKLKKSWIDIFGNSDNFENVWKVIEDSSAYAFNAPHAYSMAGDSLYQAWFKAHYPKEFYEIAIRHYQSKNKKEKINALKKEAINFYGYKLGSYKFGNDNRKVNIVDGVILPNLSSVKTFGEDVVEELFELGKSEYNSFIDILDSFPSTIRKPIINKLIRINYFDDYGDVNTLLTTFDYYNLLNNRKEISKTKLEENNISLELAKRYGNETQKKITKLNSSELLKELVKHIPYKSLSLKQRLYDQKDILNTVSLVIPSANKKLYYITELDVKKNIVNIEAYEIYSGKTRNFKMWTSQYNKQPFECLDIICITKIENKNKREPNGQINPKTGKKIYVDVPDKFEDWLKWFKVADENGEVGGYIY